MTTAPEDRLLEYALERVLGEEHSGAHEVDLAPEIVAAWERGVRAEISAEDLLAEEPTTHTVHTFPTRRRSPAWRVAAGLVAVTGLGAVLWQLAGQDSGPLEGPDRGTELAAQLDDPIAPDVGQPPFAQASRGLVSLADPAAAPTTVLEPGERMTVAGVDPVSVQFEGGRLEFEPGAVFSLHDAELSLHLEYGGVRIGGFAETFGFDFAFGAAEVLPRGVARVRIEGDEPRFEGQPERARETLLEGGTLARSIEFDVRSGDVRIRSGGERWTLHENDAYVAVEAPDGRASLALLDRDWLMDRAMRMIEFPGPRFGSKALAMGRNLATQDSELAVKDLTAFLDEDPRGWSLLHAMLIDSSEQPPARRVNLLEFLAQVDSPRAMRVARSLWARTPDEFWDDTLIAFAEAGDPGFADELRARVEIGLVDPDARYPGLRAAAYLARRGDDLGRELLWSEVQLDPIIDMDRERAVADGLLAVWGLEALGERDVWPAFADGWARTGLEALDRDMLEAARWIAGNLALYDGPPRSLPNWGSPTLWGTLDPERELSAVEVRGMLEAHLLD